MLGDALQHCNDWQSLEFPTSCGPRPDTEKRTGCRGVVETFAHTLGMVRTAAIAKLIWNLDVDATPKSPGFIGIPFLTSPFRYEKIIDTI